MNTDDPNVAMLGIVAEHLGDLGADTKQTLVVFNKMDKVGDTGTREVLRKHFPGAVFVSVLTGDGFGELVERISEFVSKGTRVVELLLPLDRNDLLARLHREGKVYRPDYEEDGIRIRATIPDRAMETLGRLVVEPLPAIQGPLGTTVPIAASR